jgi:Condensation domain
MNRELIEDIYPLPLLQEGVLFHSLLTPGMYAEQFPSRLRGPLDVGALERALVRLVARHAAFRTGFAWENTPRTMQIVFKKAEPEFLRFDWSHLKGEAWREAFGALMDDDYRRPFDMRRAPLVRMTTVRLTPNDHLHLFTAHHAVMDGWSLPLVWGDWWSLYQEEIGGAPANLPAPPRFRDYVGWVMRQDPSTSEAYWRAELAGVTAATPLPFNPPASKEPPRFAVESRKLPPESTERVQAFARGCAVTPATLVLGAWALVLARFAGVGETVCGMTVSGRPAEVPGVDRMVGMFRCRTVRPCATGSRASSSTPRTRARTGTCRSPPSTAGPACPASGPCSRRSSSSRTTPGATAASTTPRRRTASTARPWTAWSAAATRSR